MRFDFNAPTRITFGPGSVEAIGPLAAELGRRALLVVGSRTLDREGTVDALVERLSAAGVTTERLTLTGEPDTSTVELGAHRARAADSDLLVGLGGGSALDAAKAIAALATNDGPLLDYLEVVGGGRALDRSALPVVAVPTTAGTGAEVTRNAVILEPSQRYKASVRSSFLFPRVALIDPSLALTLAPSVTASTGLDALTQLIESFVSVRATPLTDALALEGIRRAGGALRRVVADGSDLAARTDLALASLESGLALANAGLGAVHGFASPLGGRYPIPHGVACAALLPSVAAANVRALRARDPNGPGLARYEQVARILLGSARGTSAATIDAGLAWLADLVRDLGVPPLRTYGVTSEAVPELVTLARQASSTRGNPIALTPEEMAEALVNALG